MKNEIRTFVAINIRAGEKIVSQMNSFKDQFIGEKINWVPGNNFHLTLRFLGNTNREQLHELVDAFEHTASKVKAFTIELKGAGYFKSKGKPRVIFLRVLESGQLEDLVAMIEKDVVSCGFHKELKPFRPHLTLGRIRRLENQSNFVAVLSDMESISYQEETVASFILYQSILLPEGPIYKSIKTFTFQ